MIFLAGDIGGTKTYLAVYSTDEGLRKPLVEAMLRSADYPTLEAMVQTFLTRVSFTIDRASFGIPGPVVAGRAKVTNLPWLMEEKQLRETLNIPIVHLLNDLEVMAHAIPFLEPDDICTLHRGHPVPHSTLALIAPGTGLGEAFLTWENGHYRARPSEGGHADFAPRDELQMQLWQFLRRDKDHVSYEQVCSGIGIPNIYTALKHIHPALEEPEWLACQLKAASDPTPLISQAALDPKKPCSLCTATLTTFASILGAEAGNLALKVLSTGGVYIGGGIAPRVLPFLQDPTFLQAFQHKGRLIEPLLRIPIYLILNPRVALLGAARHAAEQER